MMTVKITSRQYLAKGMMISEDGYILGAPRKPRSRQLRDALPKLRTVRSKRNPLELHRIVYALEPSGKAGIPINLLWIHPKAIAGRKKTAVSRQRARRQLGT